MAEQLDPSLLIGLVLAQLRHWDVSVHESRNLPVVRLYEWDSDARTLAINARASGQQKLWALQDLVGQLTDPSYESPSRPRQLLRIAR